MNPGKAIAGITFSTMSYRFEPCNRIAFAWCCACGEQTNHECGALVASELLLGLIPVDRTRGLQYTRCQRCGQLSDEAWFMKAEAADQFASERLDAVTRAKAGMLSSDELDGELR